MSNEVESTVESVEPQMVEAEINPELSVLPQNEELTEEQQLAIDNLNKIFAVRQEQIIGGILDGLAEQYRALKVVADKKAAKKKSKLLNQYDLGYLTAHEDIFNSLYTFLYTIKEAASTIDSTEANLPEGFDLFEAVEEINNIKGEVNE